MPQTSPQVNLEALLHEIRADVARMNRQLHEVQQLLETMGRIFITLSGFMPEDQERRREVH